MLKLRKLYKTKKAIIEIANLQNGNGGMQKHLLTKFRVSFLSI